MSSTDTRMGSRSSEQELAIWTDVLDDFERQLDDQTRHLANIMRSGELMAAPEPFRAPPSLPPIPERARRRAIALSLRNDALIVRARQLSDSTRMRKPTTRPRVAVPASSIPTFDQRA